MSGFLNSAQARAEKDAQQDFTAEVVKQNDALQYRNEHLELQVEVYRDQLAQNAVRIATLEADLEVTRRLLERCRQDKELMADNGD